MNLSVLLALASLASCLVVSHSAKILAVFPNYLKSHAIFTHTVVKELAKRGHDVTIITPFVEPDQLPNYRQIPADKKSCWDSDMTSDFAEQFQEGNMPIIIEEFERFDGLAWFTETAFNSTAVKEFIENDRSHFDLVMTEMFMQEAFLMFGHKYRAPVVMLSSYGSGKSIDNTMGNPMLLPVVPFEFIDFFHPMNLWQRMKNVAVTLTNLVIRKYYHLPSQQRLAELHFTNLERPLPQLIDLERKVSLVLVNTHFSIDVVRPQVPGIVEIGGVHIKERDQLTPELKKICDESKDGVILFSFGSVLKISQFPREKIDAMVKVFGGLKQTVLWKWEGDNPPKAAKNVKFFKWLPQPSIMNHPNTKLFITHGGLLGLQESIYYGVPLIGMPFFGDQFLNIDRIVKQGYGVKLQYKHVTETSLKEALDRVLNDPSYKDRAKTLSERFRDQPMTPLDTATFWIEYVIRHGGAPHLRSPILDLGWYEYLLLDVTAVAILVSLAVGIVAYCIVSVLCKLLMYRKPSKRKNKHNKEQ